MAIYGVLWYSFLAMALVFLGTDYRHIELAELEKFYIHYDAIQDFKSGFGPDCPIQEWVMLATCNRMEWYITGDNPHKAVDYMITQIASFRGVTPESVRATFTVRYEHKAMHHLFEVVAGIQSMVFGENEILSQVKTAQTVAQRHGISGPYLNKLFQLAITSGKRVRKETLIGRGSYSISSIAVDCMIQTHPDFKNARILIIGAGTMGLRSLKKLHALGQTHVSVCNRTEDKIDRLVAKYQIGHVPFANFETSITECDIVLAATSSETPILALRHIQNLTHPLLLIDLGVPRNLDTDLKQSPLVTLISIDGLKDIADKNLTTRKQELDKIMTILEEDMAQLDKWVTSKATYCPTHHSAS
jgi:glutamyl-tRNA reductase